MKGTLSLPGDVTITIRSVLADKLDARATVFTVLTDPKFFRWLPDDEDEIDRHFRVDGHSVRAWLKPESENGRQLDRQDPKATTTAMRRPLPADWVIADHELVPADDIVRRWTSHGSQVLFSEAWGAEGGRGENHWDHSGERISVSREFLATLLQRDLLVVAVKAQKYRKGISSGQAKDTSGFTHRSTVFTIDRNGEIWTPKSIPARVRYAVASLDSRGQRDFHLRFPVIRAALWQKSRV